MKTSTQRQDYLKHQIDDLSNHAFAGIKLYPPLGFDPWPEKNTAELDKVRFLYNYCVENEIPITTHCSDGGYVTDPQHDVYTDPTQWAKVLQEFSTLKLNFAHFGSQKHSQAWRDEITNIIDTYPNVYTDFAYNGVDDSFYLDMMEYFGKQTKDKQEKLKNRILFGSDYLINLLDIDSYDKYLQKFSATKTIDGNYKNLFCSENPEKFLFG